MAQSLSTTATSAGNLLGSGRFLVPEFQREYAWGLTEVREFWKDLQTAVGGSEYFLGLLIFTRDEGLKYVVDGQQRLITVSLLSKAIQVVAAELGRKALAERIESTMLFAMNYSTDQVAPRMQLTDQYDNQMFVSLLSSSSPLVSAGTITDSSDEDESDLEFDDVATVAQKMRASYELLVEALRLDLKAADAFQRVGEWAEFVMDKLYFAVFEHPDKGAAFKVFEVVNTRGKQLTTADLVKSYVLAKSEERNRTQRFQRWLAISDAFRVGGYQSQLAQYVRHVVTEHNGYVLPRDLYDFISKTYLKDAGVAKLLNELEADLAVYLQMIDPAAAGPAEGDELSVYGAFDLLDLRTVRPMLLATHRTQDAARGSRELLRLAVKRVVVGNFGTGNIERRFSSAAKLAFNETDWRPALQSLEDLNPSKDEFQAKLATRAYNKSVLYYLRSAITQRTILPEFTGVLHFIRPRNASDWAQYPDDAFKATGSTIGNTILSKLERRPKGSNSPGGFKNLLLPTGVEGELLDGESFGIGSTDDIKDMSAEMAAIGADLWYE